jgi:ubiquitin-protein ligase
MTSAASRLLREVRDISSQQIPVVFGEPEEADILHWRGMILGPPHTPYALGMFHFDLKFPQDYPNSAPKVLITTTSGGQVRFNPNLYASGKVCLSILGTWRAEHSGEQWSAVQSSQSILLSIQSLMNDAPYHNEPSFEADDGSGDVQRYNEKISHESVRVAVCEVMEDTVENRAVSSNGARRRHRRTTADGPSFARSRPRALACPAALQCRLTSPRARASLSPASVCSSLAGTSAAFSTTRKQLFFMYYQVPLPPASSHHPPEPALCLCRPLSGPWAARPTAAPPQSPPLPGLADGGILRPGLPRNRQGGDREEGATRRRRLQDDAL